MSTIGPGNIGALNLAGSLAGAQRSDASTDRNKAESAAQKFQVDQKTLTARSLGDVSEADLSSERDPDGRLPYDGRRKDDSSGKDSANPNSRFAADAFGERGSSLDIEA